MKYLTAFASILTALLVFGSYQTFDVIADTTDTTPEDDTIEGEFTSSGYNNPVEVTSFTFSEANTTTAITVGETLTPQKEYYFKLDILEYDTFEDIESVEVVFYNTTSALTVDPSTTTDGAMAVFEWNRNNAFTTAGAMALSQTGSGVLEISNTFSGITWEVTNSTAPALDGANSSTEVAFEVSFKISKVAEQGTDNWQFGYVIKDGLQNLSEVSIASNVAIEADNGATYYSMDWYGEILVPATGISWTSITPGMDFDEAGSLQTTGAIKYIANGDYYEKVQVTEVWNVTNAQLSNVTNANLTTGAIVNTTNPAQTFALRVVTGSGLSSNFTPSTNESEFVPDYDGDIYSAEIVLRNETYLADEAGRQEIYQFKVRTSTDLQNATYTGNIKFTISNSP